MDIRERRITVHAPERLRRVGGVIYNMWEHLLVKNLNDSERHIRPFMRVGQEIMHDLAVVDKLKLETDAEKDFLARRLTAHLVDKLEIVDQDRIPSFQEVVSDEEGMFSKTHKRALDNAARGIATTIVDETLAKDHILEPLEKSVRILQDENVESSPLFTPGKDSDLDRQFAIYEPDITEYRELARQESMR